MSKRTAVRPLYVVALTVLLTGLSSGALFARTADMKAFIQYYDVRSPTLKQCEVCHLPTDEEKLNLYGRDWKEAGFSEAAFREIEHIDSDGDGFSNRCEIRDGANPGDDKIVPATGSPDRPVRPDRRPSDVPPPIEDEGGVEGGPTEGPGERPGGPGPEPGDLREVPGGPEPGRPSTEGDTPPPAVVVPSNVGGTQPPGPVVAPSTESAPIPPATGDPFAGYPVLYKVQDAGKSELHLYANGKDRVINEGVRVDSFGWSPNGRYAWFVSGDVSQSALQGATSGSLYVLVNDALVKVSGDVFVAPNTVAWTTEGNTVLFGDVVPETHNVIYGTRLPDGQPQVVLQVPSGRIVVVEVAPAR